MKQAIKKKTFVIPSADDINKLLGLEIEKSSKPIKRSDLETSNAEKPTEFIPLPKAFEDALKLPGIPMGYLTLVTGWSNTGKSTIKNCLIAACQKKGILPVIYETEGNFDWKYAIDCGVDATPVYGEILDEETGEITTDIIKYRGNFVYFDTKTLTKKYGDFDHSAGKRVSKRRNVAVLEDIALSINEILDMQDEGKIKQPICFIWDSIGSITSFKSYSSKSNNNMFDAGAISQAFNSLINNRIPTSRKVSEKYTNTMFCVNKIWNDSMNGMPGIPSIELKGGKTFFYGARLIIHLGGVAKAATKKLTATAKGDTYNYGIITKIAVTKNQLPTPFNITYSGTMCCVHNGIIPEESLEEYKKTYIKDILSKLEEIKDSPDDDKGEMSAEDIIFGEEETLDE